MITSDYTTTLLVDQTPQEAFEAINNVRGWWSAGVEGGTTQLNDEFTYQHKDLHYSRQRVTALVPGKKVCWVVTDSHLSFLKGKKDAWNGTSIIFEIGRAEGKTSIQVTHQGLAQGIECFEACSGGWNYYLLDSLLPLIVSGKGAPDPAVGKSKTNSIPH